MQRIYVFSWLMALLCLSQNTQGQAVKLDVGGEVESIKRQTNLEVENSKVKINLENGDAILFSRNTLLLYEYIKKAKSIEENVKELTKYLQEFKDSLNPYVSYEIEYRKIGNAQTPLFKIKPREANTQYYKKENEQVQLTKFTQDKIHIIDDSLKYDIYVLVNSLDNLTELSQRPLNTYAKLIIQDFDENLKRYWYQENALDMVYTVEGNTIKRTENHKKPIAYLSLGLGLGLNIIRDRIVPDASLYLRASFNDKESIKLLLRGHSIFERDAEGNYTRFDNTFVGFEYGFYVGNKFKNVKYYYVGTNVEYLIRREGNFFFPDTLKIGYTFQNSRIGWSFSPQVYIADWDRLFSDDPRSMFGFQVAHMF